MQGSDSDSNEQGSRQARGATAAASAKSARRCRVDGCDACLLKEKKFYRRSRCCQHHARELQVMLDGEPRRFCQQCCGFHELAAFDGTKRSCRERLEAHNTRQREKWTVGGRRRAKSDEGADAPEAQQPPAQLQRILSAEQSAAAASAAFCGMSGGVPVQQFPMYPQPEYTVNFEGMRRNEDFNPWETPPPTVQAPGGAIIGGMSPGSGGSPSMRPPRNRRTMRSKSDKTGVWATALTDEHQAMWSASGAAVQPRTCPPAPLAGAGGSGTYMFSAANAGAQPGSEWALFKHNSAEAADMAINDALQQQDWQRRNALKRLSIDSQAIDTNPFKRTSLDQHIDREGSDVSAASGGWPVRQRGAETATRMAASAGETLKPADLGLHNADEARAFAEQAPDPLWLAQRLIGSELAAKTRPEYSYGRQFRGHSMDSATARIADSLDAVAAHVSELSRMSGARMQSQPWAEAAQLPTPSMSQDERSQAQAFFQPPPPLQQQQLVPNAFARASGPASFTPTLMADMTLGSGWDTNEGTLGSVMTGDTFMSDARPNGFAAGTLQPAAGWPQVLNSYGEFDAEAPTAGSMASLQGGRHAGLLGQHSLAAMGQQLSAPPLMQR